jgi:hypothetical protein
LFEHTITNVEKQFLFGATQVNNELEKKFHTQDIMDDELGVIYF